MNIIEYSNNNWVILPIRNELNDLENHLNQLNHDLFLDLYDGLLILNKNKNEIIEMHKENSLNLFKYNSESKKIIEYN